MNARFLLISVFILFEFTISAQKNFEKAVEQLMQKPEYKNASVGMKVLDLSSGETVFAMNPDRVLAPASTMKLITSATAFELLGKDYRFETKIGYQGSIGKNGELTGDLVLVGGADPALGSEYFQNDYIDFLQNWARQVKNAGIKKVNGNLILDASVYDKERVPDTWIWGDIGNYYGVGPNAFTVYDNLFRITFSSPKKADKPTTVIGVYPEIEGMKIENEVRSADTNTDNAYVFGGPFDKARVIRGTIPRNRKAFTIKAAVHQPEEILAQEFIKALANEGVFISGESLYEKVGKKHFETLFIQQSPSLGEIAEVLNHESVNLFAEHFLKQIAFEKNGLGKRQDGIEIVKEFWQSKGISTEYLFMEDGSGLSHFNAVSPEFFTQLLSYMATNETFLNSLPCAGEGTFKRFDKTLLPGKTLQAKSGSMTRVRCYSGYLKTDSGKTLVFSFMFNHFSGSHSVLIKEVESLFLSLRTSL
jgi:D-alanyl-D-alanine carboxypeptidase/D-alanyl-D-alanine-endopeptidase (penicillin-binding protein 4)